MKKIDLIRAGGSFIEHLIDFLKSRKLIRNQRTFCWCPICKEDLCSNNSFISDTDLVRYECNNCGCRSSWDFDLPAPLLINKDEIIYNKNT